MEKEYKLKSVEMVSPKYEQTLGILNKTIEEIEVLYGITTLNTVLSKNSKLKRVILPETLITISNTAFEKCYSLEYLEIPKSLKSIKSDAFDDCNALLDLNYRGTMEQWNSIELDSYWHYGSSIERVICSDGIITL